MPPFSCPNLSYIHTPLYLLLIARKNISIMLVFSVRLLRDKAGALYLNQEEVCLVVGFVVSSGIDGSALVLLNMSAQLISVCAAAPINTFICGGLGHIHVGSSMIDEQWKCIAGFPRYSVSDLGNVMNNDSGRDMQLTLTAQGAVKVGLVLNGRQYTRSVKVLVADAFVDGKSDIFNTPINLDGHQHNNTASNLVWRPRWFAWKYARQFTDVSTFHDRGPIFDDQDVSYPDVYIAAITNGLLFRDVWRSINMNLSCWPTGQIFRFDSLPE